MSITKKLITLDSLFDTRYGCLKRFNKKIAEEILMKEDFFLRSSNFFSVIDKRINDDVLEKIWKNRDVTILRESFGTNVVNILSQTQEIYGCLEKEHPEAIEMHLTISLYPYILKPKELKELARVLKHIIKPASLTCTNKGIKHFSPLYIRNKYDHLIIHDLDEWIINHCEELKENPIPFIRITAPVNHNVKKKDEKINPLIYENVNKDTGTHVNVELLPLSDFSICPPVQLEGILNDAIKSNNAG